MLTRLRQRKRFTRWTPGLRSHRFHRASGLHFLEDHHLAAARGRSRYARKRHARVSRGVMERSWEAASVEQQECRWILVRRVSHAFLCGLLPGRSRRKICASRSFHTRRTGSGGDPSRPAIYERRPRKLSQSLTPEGPDCYRQPNGGERSGAPEVWFAGS